jgi:hypothetical protein
MRSTKHQNILIAAATLGTAVASLLASTATAQAAVFATVSGESEPKATDDMFFELQKQLEPIQNASRALQDMIAGASDPISLDTINIEAVGKKLAASGAVKDMTAWDHASKLIENKGFAAYLEELRTMNSALDRTFASADQQFKAWQNKGTDGIDVIADSRDDDVTTMIAAMGSSVTYLHSFGTAGMMMLHEVGLIDQGKVSETQKIDPALV